MDTEVSAASRRNALQAWLPCNRRLQMKKWAATTATARLGRSLPGDHLAGRSKEEIHFGSRGQFEERTNRHQKADEAESTDREEVRIVRLIVAHLAPDQSSCFRLECRILRCRDFARLTRPTGFTYFDSRT